MITNVQQRIPQNVIVTPFDPSCAWCRHAQCITTSNTESHGICAMHAELVEEEARARRFQRIRDGREAS